MLRAPGGRPTSLHTSPNSKHVLEASSDGLCIAAQPAASPVEEGVVFGFRTNPAVKCGNTQTSSEAKETSKGLARLHYTNCFISLLHNGEYLVHKLGRYLRK
nr:hypothetical protein Iba_chr09dCG9560 [Ipomoea batatas]